MGICVCHGFQILLDITSMLKIFSSNYMERVEYFSSLDMCNYWYISIVKGLKFNLVFRFILVDVALVRFGLDTHISRCFFILYIHPFF
jgi:hypothetical protein